MIPTLSTRAGHEAATRRLSRLSEQLAEVQQQIATGKKVLKPGDAPVAFARAASLSRADAMADAQRRAMDAAAARLSASEVALAGIADITLRARELALAAANDTLTASDRSAMAAEVRELAAAARALAETRGPDGEALFAGAGTPPPDPAVPPPPRERNLFDSLMHLANTLAEPRPTFFRAGIDEAIAAITGHGDRLAQGQALLGSRAARIEAEAERLDDVQLALKSDISKLVDTDLAEAVARLDRLGVVLEAAQASFARVARLSLWDQIR